MGDHELVGVCAAQASQGALRLAHDIRHAEKAGRALETLRKLNPAPLADAVAEQFTKALCV